MRQVENIKNADSFFFQIQSPSFVLFCHSERSSSMIISKPKLNAIHFINSLRVMSPPFFFKILTKSFISKKGLVDRHFLEVELAVRSYTIDVQEG